LTIAACRHAIQFDRLHDHPEGDTRPRPLDARVA